MRRNEGKINRFAFSFKRDDERSSHTQRGALHECGGRRRTEESAFRLEFSNAFSDTGRRGIHRDFSARARSRGKPKN